MSTPVTVHMVGNAHIDPVWLWPLAEGRAEVQSTYRTAMSLLEEFEGYVFTSGGAVTYEWVRQDDPALFASIQQAVEQERWVLVNGWWLQPDCNIPHGESFARQALYGQRYLEKHFGQRACVGYNVDTFGHAGTLPQILKLSGLDYYVFVRPGPHEKTLPEGPFWWQALGGTRVLACRPPLHYGSSGEADVVERAAQAAAQALPDLPEVMCFYGVGNHGGGPTQRNVRDLVASMGQDDEVRPIFSSPDAFFQRMAALKRDWPVVQDELQHHARGCYSALSRVKRENRWCEHALMQAERWDALASVLREAPAAREALRQAWQGVLFNQFHDILAGTSLRSAYEDTWRLYDRAQQTAREVQEQALQSLEARLTVPAREEQRPVLVWNPSPWTRQGLAHIVLPLGGWRHDRTGARYPAQPIVRDAEGLVLPSQLAGVVFDYNTYLVHLDVLLEVPAMGARLVYVKLPDAEPPAESPVAPAAASIENEYLRLEVDPDTGWLTSIRDLTTGRQLLAEPGGVPLVIDDPSDTWSHDVEAFREVIGRFRATGPARLLHDGPVKRTLRVESAWGQSTIIQDITLIAGQRTIEVALTIDWHEQLKMLKLAYPLALENARVTADAPYGHTTRPVDGQEHPCQAWVDVSGDSQDGPWGMCLLNDSKYGYDALGGELRLSLLRSPIYAFHRPREIRPGVEYQYIDQGKQTVRLRLAFHDGDWRAVQPDRLANALQQPLIARPVAPQAGDMAPCSLLAVEPANIVLTTVKRSEGDERLLVRGFEAAGQPTDMVLSSGLFERRWSCHIAPYELFTLALPLKSGEPIRLNLLEEAL